MKLALKTPPASEPVTLAEVKKHLKLAVTDAEATAYTTEDAELSAFIATAREIVEARTGKRLITQTWYIYLDGWPSGKVLFLPYPPLQSATVKYKCVGDAGYDNEVSDVLVDTQCSPGRLVLPSGAPWPPSGDLLPRKSDSNRIQVRLWRFRGGLTSAGASFWRRDMFLSRIRHWQPGPRQFNSRICGKKWTPNKPFARAGYFKQPT